MNVEATLGAFHFEGEFETDAEILGVFGPSGAGKTTLLHLIAGLLKPDRGRISLDGETLFDHDAKTSVPAHRRRMGLVFQDNRLFPHLTVRGNLRFAKGLLRRRSPTVAWNAVVEMLDLGPLLDRRIGTLSIGERQRVAIGRALLSSPRLLLLDEPVSAVDAGRRAHILPMLRRITRDLRVPMAIVSHELSQLLFLTDHLLLIENGRCLAHGRFADLLHNTDALRLLRAGGITNLLRLRADQHLAAEGITLCSLQGSGENEASKSIRGPLTRCDPGTELTATLRPEDIILSPAPADQISAQNQMPGRIKTLIQNADRVLCCVDVGADLFVDVTHRSATGLDLKPGGKIWCLFKTCAIKYLFEEVQTDRKAETDSHDRSFPATRAL
jgi:molybdate transport system ATP-binding protein